MSEDNEILSKWDQHGSNDNKDEPAPSESVGDSDPIMNDPRRQELDNELNPKRSCLHRFFILISITAGLCAFNMALGQFVGLAVQAVGIIQGILRVYVIIFCVLIMLNELEWTSLTTNSTLLKFWISRGIFYAFVGVLGLEENDVSPENKNMTWAGRHAAMNYIKVVAWMMIGVGMIYFVMGIFCLQLVCNRMRKNYKERLNRAKNTGETLERFRDIT